VDILDYYTVYVVFDNVFKLYVVRLCYVLSYNFNFCFNYIHENKDLNYKTIEMMLFQ